MDMDELVNGTPAAPKVEATAEQPVEQHEQPAEQAAVEGAPTAPASESQHVPLAALEAERKGRQDWKEKAIRYEEELKQLRQQQPVQQQPQGEQDPLQSMQQQIVNERFNTSEMIARQTYKDVDEKVAAFQEAARANPALSIALQQQRHPWDFAYKEGQRLLMLKELGDDPIAYREKIKAELMAEIAKPVARTPLPESLAGARSAAPRSAPGFTGPTPLEDLMVNQRR
jgi:hypothetical protein